MLKFMSIETYHTTSTSLTVGEQAQEYLKCAADPIYFIENYIKIFDQTQDKIVPFLLFPEQKSLVRKYKENKKVITNKYRQGGISTTTCAYITWYLAFNDDRYVVIVADKLETARDEIMSDVLNFIEDLPDFLKPKIKIGGADKNSYKEFDNGSKIKAMASKKLRGPTPTLLFWDECAHAEHGETFWTSAAATLATGGSCILVSTPNGLDSVFYKTFTNAVNKDSDFVPVLLHWYYDPRYNVDLRWVHPNTGETIQTNDYSKFSDLLELGYKPTSSWYEMMCRDYNFDKKKIAQELECSFEGSGGNYIDDGIIKKQEEHHVREPKAEEYLDKQMWIWEDPKPNAVYGMGIDVSTGRGDDYSTIEIFEIEDNKLTQVGEYRGKVAPDVLGDICNYYGRQYNNALAIVDITGGVGITTAIKLVEREYPNIYYSKIRGTDTKEKLRDYVKLIDDDEYYPGITIGTNRGMILITMERALRGENDEIILRSSRLVSEFKTFVSVDGERIADHRRSFNDDLIIAFAIFVYVLNSGLADINTKIEDLKKLVDNIKIINNNENETNEKQWWNTENVNYKPTAHDYGKFSWLFTKRK
jgi:hypothetical protein